MKKNKGSSGTARAMSARRRIGRVQRPSAAGKPSLRRPAGTPAGKPQPATKARGGSDFSAASERQRFLTVLDTLPACLVILSEDYHIPFANKFFRERFGESGGRRCYEYLFHHDAPCENCRSFLPFTTKKMERWEWRGPDGRDFDIYDFPFTDVDGATLVMEMGIDITERKRAEAELAEINAALGKAATQRAAELAHSEQRWATTLASIGDAVIAADCSGRITFLNPTAESLTGWSRSEAAGRRVGEVFQIISEETRAPLEDPVVKVLATGAVVGLANHTLLIHKDGTEIAIDDSGAPIRGPDGEATGVVLVFRDITERRKAEREISSLAKFPAENPNPIMRADSQGALQYVNEAGRGLLGGPFAEKGKTLPGEWLDLMKRAQASGRNETADLAFAGKTWLATATPIAGEAYVNLYAVDITELRSQERELLRLNRTLKAVSDSNQAMMRAQDEQSFMDAACRIVVEDCGHAMVWIGFAEHDEAKSVRPVAHAGFEEGYLETLKITWADTERGRGPTGMAIRTGAPTLCRNMLTDPAFAPWRAEALRRGYASSIALPLAADGAVFGAISIYCRDPDPFSEEEVALLSELANDLGYGIQTIRTRAARDELLAQVEEQRTLAQRRADELDAIFANLSEAVLVYDSEGQVHRSNEALRKNLGFDPTQLSTADVAARLNTRYPDGRSLDPGRSPTARALTGQSVSNERYRIQGAGGRELTVLASSAPLRRGERVYGAVTVMHDVTEEDYLIAEARRQADELDATFASMTEAVLVYDQRSILRRINQAGLSLFGTDPTGLDSAEILRRFNIRHPDGRPVDLSIRPIAHALEGSTVSGEPYIFTNANGAIVSVQIASAPLREGESVVGAVTVLHDVTEQERLLAEVQRRAAELDAVINSIGDGIMIHGPHAELLRTNPAADKMLGYTEEDLHLPFAKRSAKSIRIEAENGRTIHDTQELPISRALRGETVTGEVLGLRQSRTGNVTWVSVSAEPLRAADRTVFGAVSSLTDITERKEMENQLRQNRDHLESEVKERTRELAEAGAYNRSLIEASIDPQVTITPEGKIGDVNAATEAATGFSRKELIGTDFSDYFTDPEKARTGYQRVFAEGKISDYELELRHRDGHVMPVLYNASVYRDETGAVKGIIAAARDITQRRQVEGLLRLNVRRTEVIAQISHLLAEAGPNYQAVLPTLAERTANLFGGACRIHLPDADGRLSLEAHSGADSPEQPESLADVVFQTRQTLFLPAQPNGETAPPNRAVGMIVPLLVQDAILGTLTVARTAADKPLSPEETTLIRTIADRIAVAITNSRLFADLKNALAEEQKARQQLIRTEKLAAMGRLLGSVAHELNNPLQTIKNCLYLVQQESPPISEIQNYIGMASSETERLVHLVAELRELYRPRTDHTPALWDLADILGEVRNLMEQPLLKGKVRWEQTGAAKGCIVRCEKERIQQIVINLATNAIEAMQPAGGKLTVELIRDDSQREAGVVFRDTGPGIPLHMLGNVFEPFVTTKPSGLGLGLPICYEIAQKHGGRLTAESPPGSGAVFTLWLPLAKGERQDAQPSSIPE
jgi:PAS domain S-box-containing protein